jgi:hypothetical protein
MKLQILFLFPITTLLAAFVAGKDGPTNLGLYYGDPYPPV